MSPRVIAVAGILASLACRPDPAQPSTTPATHARPSTAPTEPIPVGSAVMVVPGGTVWLDAAGTQPIELPAQLPGGGIAMIVVRDHGATLEVDTATMGACASPLVQDFALRLFVAKSDLQVITRSRIEHTLATKQTVRIAAGAPVDGEHGDRWIAVVSGETPSKVPVPASEVVDHVRPPLDNGPCVSVLDNGEPVPIDIGDPAVWAALIQANANYQGTTSRVRKGATVYWRDGANAGTVASDHTFIAAAAVAGTRSCLPLALADDNATTLCFDTKDLTAGWQPRSCASHLHAALCFDTENPPAGDAGEGTIGLGNLGLIGKGGGGKGGGGKVRQAVATIKGALDKDVIRRIVRSHINEIRRCYDEALLLDPNAAGRLVVNLTIDAKGTVETMHMPPNQVGGNALSLCVGAAVMDWKFPKPTGGGKVTVSYPFLLETGK